MYMAKFNYTGRGIGEKESEMCPWVGHSVEAGVIITLGTAEVSCPVAWDRYTSLKTTATVVKMWNESIRFQCLSDTRCVPPPPSRTMILMASL